MAVESFIRLYQMERAVGVLNMLMENPLEMPENITIRGEAYDFIITPVCQNRMNIRLKNLLKIKELKEKIVNLAETDELTGLHNRRYLIERLDAEISRAKRYGKSVSVILFDIVVLPR